MSNYYYKSSVSFFQREEYVENIRHIVYYLGTKFKGVNYDSFFAIAWLLAFYTGLCGN